ncbi:MAG: TonB family protein [candidate division WOR-3 bacterium]
MKRELLISFAGHIGILIFFGIVSGFRQQRRDSLRPSIITVQILRSHEPATGKSEPATQLLQTPLKPVTSKKTPEKAKNTPPPKTEVIRGAGLGAKIEGVSALGYNFYLQQMLERIASNWQDPYSGSARNIKTTVVFVIERSGLISEIKIENGSGDPLFDESCLRAVIITKKLPPLPDEFTAPRLKIHLEFER